MSRSKSNIKFTKQTVNLAEDMPIKVQYLLSAFIMNGFTVENLHSYGYLPRYKIHYKSKELCIFIGKHYYFPSQPFHNIYVNKYLEEYQWCILYNSEDIEVNDKYSRYEHSIIYFDNLDIFEFIQNVFKWFKIYNKTIIFSEKKFILSETKVVKEHVNFTNMFKGSRIKRYNHHGFKMKPYTSKPQYNKNEYSYNETTYNCKQYRKSFKHSLRFKLKQETKKLYYEF